MSKEFIKIGEQCWMVADSGIIHRCLIREKVLPDTLPPTWNKQEMWAVAIVTNKKTWSDNSAGCGYIVSEGSIFATLAETVECAMKLVDAIGAEAAYRAKREFTENVYTSLAFAEKLYKTIIVEPKSKNSHSRYCHETKTWS